MVGIVRGNTPNRSIGEGLRSGRKIGGCISRERKSHVPLIRPQNIPDWKNAN